MNLRIKITKWVDERSDSPEIAVLTSDDDGVWRSGADSLEQEAVDLQEALFVNPGGAIRIDVERGAPSLEQIADALPKTLEYMKGRFHRWSADWGSSTGDDDIDQITDNGGIPVLISGERWGLFETSGRWDPANQRVSEFVWLLCDQESLHYSKAKPVSRRFLWWDAGWSLILQIIQQSTIRGWAIWGQEASGNRIVSKMIKFTGRNAVGST